MVTEKICKKVLVLGTGGTIAGTASSAADNLAYRAAQLTMAQLLAAVPGLSQVLQPDQIVCEQVAQLDSKDMGFAVWLDLAQRLQAQLARDDILGAVVTHGTDTLEETAFFLHAALPAALSNAKPVVLTCAMRPASSYSPDGPQNLRDAIAVVLTAGAHGVMALCAGTLHSALEVQKSHTYRLDAFSSGDAGPLGYVEEGQLRLLRSYPLLSPDASQTSLAAIAASPNWPRVEILMSYAGCDGALVDALLAQQWGARPLRALVVAASGNGTLHCALEAALLHAQLQGVKIVRATRCANGRVLAYPGQHFPDSQGLSPVKARIALMLALINEDRQ